MMISEKTKTKIKKSTEINGISWFLFAFVAVSIYFFALSIPLLGPDEPRYTQIAREMFERGDWITPKLAGFDWFEKPALLYWLQIFSFKIFGVSESAARFGSALFGLGTIFCLLVLGRNFTDKNKAILESKDFANYLALIAASSLGLLAFSRGASFDIILTFPVTASLVAFFIFDQTKNQSKIFVYGVLLIAYFFIGIALIGKGLVGLIFPLGILAFYYLLSRRFPSRTFIFSLFWGVAFSILVACTWYLPMYHENGWKFIDEFIIQHHFQRYTSNKYQHPQPFWFFWAILPLMTFPWLPFFLISLWKSVEQNEKLRNLFNFRTKKIKRSNARVFFFSPLSIFALSWMLVPLVFFSLSGSKLPGYILPALPGALILTSFSVYEFARKSAGNALLIKLTAFITFAAVAIILQFFIMDYANHETTKNLIETTNQKGLGNEKILNLYTVTHNLEFYAAGRLVRDANGKMKRYDDFSELAEDLRKTPERRILISAPLKDVPNLLNENKSGKLELIAENGETAILLFEVR